MFRLCFFLGKTCRQQTFITFPRRRNFSNQKIRWKADGDTFPTRFLVSKTKSWSQSYDSFFNLFFNQNVKTNKKWLFFNTLKNNMFSLFLKNMFFNQNVEKQVVFQNIMKNNRFLSKNVEKQFVFQS